MTPAPTAARTCRNHLEPAGLLGHFLAQPPEDFTAHSTDAGAPGFYAVFDLLTTMEPALRAKIERLPIIRTLARLLRFRTCFWGSTVTEYAPLPAALSAPETLAHLRQQWAQRTLLMIVKDLPERSPLLPEADSAHAAAMIEAAKSAGFILVEGQALAYVPIDFDSEDAYLARLSSGRRRDIRRKLRSREHIQIELLRSGDARFGDPQLLEQMYTLYRGVYDQSEIHFDLLSAEFFRALLQDPKLDGRIFFYHADGKMIGYNICFVHDGMLIDKYVGLAYPAARDHNLYFVSWMENLAYARSQGLRHYVAGWTDPQIKAYLGAQFTFTHHAVWVRNPILRAILRRLAHLFEGDRAWFDAQQHDASPRS